MKKASKFNLSLILILGFFTFLSSSCKKDEAEPNVSSPSLLVADIDGNIYHTVRIGSQVWMVENLKTTHFRNGEAILNVTDSTEWGNFATAYYCNYNNDNSYVETYGRLYNYYAVINSRNIAPTGWHVPTNMEWETLENFLGGYNIAGAKLKEKGSIHWGNANNEATNETGFNALPGGCRTPDGKFTDIGSQGNWRSSSARTDNSSWNCNMVYFSNYLYRNSAENDKKSGYSIRCIQD
jgi:uncharacterized protein (TIGR02145 family)